MADGKKSWLTLLRESKPNRREFVAAMIAAVFVDLGRSGGESAIERLSELSHSRRALLYNAFFADSKFEVIPSDESSLRPQTVEIGTVWTYPTDQAAIAAIQAICTVKRSPVRDRFDADLDASSILIGSSASNSETRAILGSLSKPDFVARCGERIINLPYGIKQLKGRALRFTNDEERRVLVRSLVSKDGKERRLRNRDGKELKLADPNIKNVLHEKLGDDYLLVCHLPGPVQHTTRTIFAGLHAPATRSLDLLFEQISDNDLTILANLAKKGAYQAVFHVRGLEERHGTTTGQEILLDKNQFPPISVG